MRLFLASREKGHEQGMPSKTSWKDIRCRNLSISPRKDDGFRLCSPPYSKATRERRLVHTPLKIVGTSSPCATQFQALRDLLENYLDLESCSSVSAPPWYHSFVGRICGKERSLMMKEMFHCGGQIV